MMGEVVETGSQMNGRLKKADRIVVALADRGAAGGEARG
ncbi:threonine dehydrogenase-like Zn-dependent dehydrogenase [Rhizobium sp. BK512]|jgi:hypothetical protein|nr:threonine dehydrogenase-like Zn-dependent dehydrogenase [Rhizobium sp. BK379]MBB3565529.1 threonine dehydrogenase-like Zn-dependent dehydrogenase [Rhizobium sp. BK512]